MKIEGYERLKGFAVPSYWYEEGDTQEQYWIDDVNMWFAKFYEYYDDNGDPLKEDTRKWYMIMATKPIGTKVTEENWDTLVKWVVDESYHKDNPYEWYEWDFENHKIKDI